MSEKSPWTHSICDTCWEKYFGFRGEPTRVMEKHRDLERCCWCHGFHFSGIWQRNDPTDRNMKCGGMHEH